MANPHSSDGTYPLLLRFWTDDTQSSLIATVTAVERAYQDDQPMAPFDHEFTLLLDDSEAASITSGTYYELWVGDSSPQTLRMNGYVQTITINVDVPGGYDIAGASAAIGLDDVHSVGHTIYDPSIFSSVIDVFNGVQSPAGSGQYPPGYRGIYTGTGRVARWVDNKPPAATTTTTGGDSVGGTTLNVASTIGFTQKHWLQVNGTDSYLITGIISGTQLGIYPALNGTYAAGVTVADLGYVPVGFGDKSRSDWESDLLTTTAVCSHYGIFWRDTVGAKIRNGFVDMGPLGDPSGITYWGQENVRQDLHSTQGLPLLDSPNAGLAQQYGYAMVDTLTYTFDLSKIKNLFWGDGHGQPDKGGVTLRSLVGGDPFNDTVGSPGSPVNGWVAYQPHVGGRLYFVKPASRTTYEGATYEFICYQGQDSVFRYGCINRGTSVGTNNPPPFDLREDFLHVRTITDASWLLSAFLGHLMWDSQPVGTYELTVRHPMTSGAIPAFPQPGQTITLNYTGYVESMGYDTNTLSLTYGQLIPTGVFSPIDYPNTTDPNLVAKLKKVVRCQEEWSSDGQYVQTITLGRGKWHSGYWADHLAVEMERHVHNPQPHQQTSSKKDAIDAVQWILSQGAQGASTGWATDTNGVLNIQPSGIAVADVPRGSSFFADHTVFNFTINAIDNASALRVWIAKAIDQTTQNPSSTRNYVVAQLGFATSSLLSGIFTTLDGTTLTGHGEVFENDALNNAIKIRGSAPWRVSVHWTNGLWEVFVGLPSSTGAHWFRVAQWQDPNHSLIAAYGTVGFQVVGGTTAAQLAHIWAQAHQPGHVAKGSVRRTEEHPHAAHKRRARKAGAGSAGLARGRAL